MSGTYMWLPSGPIFCVVGPILVGAAAGWPPVRRGVAFVAAWLGALTAVAPIALACSSVPYLRAPPGNEVGIVMVLSWVYSLALVPIGFFVGMGFSNALRARRG